MNWTVYLGDVRETLRSLPAGSIQCCVTSPPYWGLRDYGVDGQIGQEPTPDAYVQTMVEVFREVRRVLHESGTVWLNVGDSYAGSWGNQGRKDERGSQRPINGPMLQPLAGQYPQRESHTGAVPDGLKSKDLYLIPWRLALALQADGWWVRSVICWAKKSCMPESVTDRPTNSWEPIFLLAKSAKYFYDAEAVKEPSTERPSGNAAAVWEREDRSAAKFKHSIPYQPDATGRNQRNVWHLGPEPFSEWGETVRLVRVALGDADGDTMRTTSPDCRAHAGQPDRVPTALRGERVNRECVRILGSDARLAQARLTDSDPSDSRPVADSAPSSLDFGDQPNVPIATGRNTGTRKTGRVPATSPACIPSAQTTDDTDGRLASLGSVSSVACIDIAGDIDEACSCEYYRLVTEKTSHFATFPTEIPRRAIKAGTSEKGCCPMCFAPWERQTESTKSFESGSGRSGNRPNGKQDLGASETNSTPDIRMGPVVSTRTLGWEPGCECEADPIPCTVLDPFTGSGTTGEVAIMEGRNFIGCELNPEYVTLARKRIHSAAPLFAQEVVR